MDLVKESCRILLGAGSTHTNRGSIAFEEKFAKAFGLLYEDPVYHINSVNPEVVKAELPARTTASGRIYHELPLQNLGSYNHNELTLGNTVDGTIHLLYRQFKDAMAVDSRSVLVYSSLVQPTIMGNQKHQLLREIFIPHKDHDNRQLVEPRHYQWLPVENRQTEVVEVILEDLNGGFIKLPRGKTLVTVAVRHSNL